MILKPGTHLGPYEIRAPLGAGGMGEVYRAKDKRLEREVAIKVLPEHLADDQAALARFEREAKAVAALSHPNILAVYDVGTEQGVSFVVTELLEGETLRERLRGSALPWRKAIEIGAGIADGLAAAHAKGIVHQDVKPENIFVTSDGVVKILDFGLAHRRLPASPQQATDSPTITVETSPGTLLGTAAYMSPEQVRSETTDARSDVFSVGCVLHEMVSGCRSFERKTIADTLAAILKDEPPDIDTTATGVPPELDRLIQHCLEKKPEERFQSARDLAFDLRSILTESARRAAQATAAPGPSRASTWVVVACVAVVALAALYVGFNVRNWRKQPTTSVQRRPDPLIKSLVVLPLENLSGDPEQEYFVDGMTDALIANLGQISALRVISRTSAMRYKGTHRTLPEIAGELSVDAVVEGSVIQAGSRVRISARLIRAATAQHLWSDSYEHELRDILALQRDVAEAIAREIQVKLTPQEQSHFESIRRVNPRAYEAYVKGRYFWNKRTGESLRKSIAYFERAIDIDPTYASAYAGLADAYVILGNNHWLPLEETIPHARQAALKALEMDENLADAYIPLAAIRYWYEWDFSKAEDEIKRAIDLNANSARAHQCYAGLLSVMGRHEEALAEIERAWQLDPLSLVINANKADFLLQARQYDRAVEQYRKLFEMDPGFPWHVNFGIVLELKGEVEEAFAEYRADLRTFYGATPEQLAAYEQAFAAGGMSGARRWLIEYLKGLSEQRHVSPLAIATAYALLGEADDALEWLERAYEQRDTWLVDLKVDPVFDPLRGDPRFDDLVRRIGLDPGAYPKPQADTRLAGKIMLAVLPFADMSPEPQDWFSDGMTEEMIAQLGRLQPKKLGVIARTSAMHYKSTDKTIGQIGRELGVDYILEGSVRRADDQVRITAKLIQVSDQTQLWGAPFDGELIDIFALQADVAERIARSLAVELLPEQAAALARPLTIDPAAHEAYLKGRYYWSKRTEEGFRTALDYFQQAIDKDPTYALAHAAVADCYLTFAGYGILSPSEASSKAKAAAQRALELDDSLGEAHCALGAAMSTFDWNWAGAEREYLQAIELNPSYAVAHMWYAEDLSYRGRHSEALASVKRAQQLDPLSLIINVAVGGTLYRARQYDQAVEESQKAIALDPDFAVAHYVLAQSYLQKGMHAEGVAELRRALLLSDDLPKLRAWLAYGLALKGQTAEAREILDALTQLSGQRYVSSVDIAMIYVGLGENDEAFAWLEKAFDERDVLLVALGIAPIMDPLRHDPRFDDLLRRIGLEP